jgi:uncharacterized protein involved in type VI secretion and phage assembly
VSGLADLLSPDDADRGAKVHGVVTGVVTNNQDPDKLARVKVRFPWLSGDDESWWARLAVPMAGPDAGTYFLPEIDDEVLVAFEHGDVRFPYVLGALWRGGDPAVPPPQDNASGKNERSVLRSRSGLTVTLDDTDGKERIVIADKNDKATVIVNAADQAVSVQAGKEVTVVAQDGKVTIEAGDVVLRAKSGKLTLEGADVEITSKAGLKLQATGTVDVKGALLNLG